MPVVTHPLSPIASDLFDLVAARIGVVKASFWMFAGNAALDGASPIQALKAGRVDDVKRAIFAEEPKR